MMTREQLKQKYEAIHEHFNFKDFLGLSALIFGLLLSNSSLEPVTAKAELPAQDQPVVEKEAEPAPKVVKKKVTKVKKKKKILKSKKRRQQVTAANKK